MFAEGMTFSRHAGAKQLVVHRPSCNYGRAAQRDGDVLLQDVEQGPMPLEYPNPRLRSWHTVACRWCRPDQEGA